MNSFKLIFIVAVILLAFASGDLAYAGSGCGGDICTGKSYQKGEVINTTCPVMGGEVDNDTPYRVEHKGKTIGFCCSACVEKFNADPDKHMKKIFDKDENM